VIELSTCKDRHMRGRSATDMQKKTDDSLNYEDKEVSSGLPRG